MSNLPPRARDPLDALQLLVNDVLVQTGKALRASRRDSHGNVAPAHGPLQAKLPDTIKHFHAALDDLESDIIRAKSVLLRDLNELQAQKKPLAQLQSQPVEPPSKTNPMTIDLDSSPPPAPKEQTIKSEPAAKPVAPFPDMGMSLPEPAQPDTVIKEEDDAAQAPSAAALEAPVKAEVGAGIPPAEVQPAHEQLDAAGADDTLGMNSELNFTDMEFTLAPTNNEAHEPFVGEHADAHANDPSFDLTSFAHTAEGANGSSLTMASLDTILPVSLAGPTEAPTSTNDVPKVDGEKTSEPPDESNFADMFTSDGQADGMDFDFSLGDVGMGGDTFDDLMNDRDNTFDTMEHGDFDNNYFGLDKTDDS